jgi:hypothetical protein
MFLHFAPVVGIKYFPPVRMISCIFFSANVPVDKASMMRI